jgi:hypothetical protein
LSSSDKTNFDVAARGQRIETTLRQTTLQRHLTAFETDLVETAGARFLALVTTTRGLAQTAADAATDTLGRAWSRHPASGC